MPDGLRTDLKQKAYEYIKNKIIKCEWMPERDISEEEIVREIGISRTPVREALQRLENEKLVVIYPRKGIFVSGISVGVVNSVFQVREMVEPQILRAVIDRLPSDWLKQMRDRFSENTGKGESPWRHIDLDREFHTTLVKASANIYLIQLMENIYAQDERIRILSWKFIKKADVTNAEHLEIINAILDGDPEKAEEAMRRHVQNAREAALKLL